MFPSHKVKKKPQKGGDGRQRGESCTRGRVYLTAHFKFIARGLADIKIITAVS